MCKASEAASCWPTHQRGKRIVSEQKACRTLMRPGIFLDLLDRVAGDRHVLGEGRLQLRAASLPVTCSSSCRAGRMRRRPGMPRGIFFSQSAGAAQRRLQLLCRSGLQQPRCQWAPGKIEMRSVPSLPGQNTVSLRSSLHGKTMRLAKRPPVGAPAKGGDLPGLQQAERPNTAPVSTGLFR